MNGQLQDPAALLPRKESLEPIELKRYLAPAEFLLQIVQPTAWTLKRQSYYGSLNCLFFGVGHFCNVFSFAGSVVTPFAAKAIFCPHSNLNTSNSSAHSWGGEGIYKQKRANFYCPLRFGHHRWYYIGFHYTFPEAGTFSYKASLQPIRCPSCIVFTEYTLVTTSVVDNEYVLEELY